MSDKRDHLDHETLQRFLSDLARLGARHGVELAPDTAAGTMRLVPLSPGQGGYLAERVDVGPRVLSSYEYGVKWDGSTDDTSSATAFIQAHAKRGPEYGVKKMPMR